MLKKLLPHSKDGGKPKMLPPPRFMSQENEQETLLAREILGIVVHPAKNGEAAVRSLRGDNVERAIAYHQSSSFVDGTLLLQDALRFSSDLTFLIRALKQTPESFLQHVQNQKDFSKNEVRTSFLDEVVEWALPKRNVQISGHDLLIWGPKDRIVPEGREKTAALYGKIVSYMQAGSAIRSVIYGLPMEMTEMRRDPVTGSVDPVWYASPRKVIWYPRFYLLPDVNIAFSFWSGIVTPENISQILGLGDLLLRPEVVGGYLYASALLRVASRAENGKVDFSNVSAQLAKLDKWEQRSGPDIRTAFQAFIPGSSPQPFWQGHSVSKPQQVLKKLTMPLKTIGDRDGTNMMGLIGDQPLLLNPMLRPGRLYVGPSKTGKSTLAAAHAIQVTPNIVWLPLTAGQFEGAPYWVGQMGGTIIDLDLPDAYALSLNSNGAKSNHRLLEQKQEELHISDKADAEAKMHEIEEEWYRLDRITGLPLTFRVISGDSVRLLNFYTHFLNAWKDAWRRWYEKTGEWSLLVADNFSALQLAENDAILGDMPFNTGRNLGISLAWMVSNGRNMGTACWILTHSAEDLDYISSGLHSQFGLEVSLSHNDYTMAKVLQPKEREEMVPRLFINLPKPIRSVVERREPTQDGQPWLQKERSKGY